MQRVDEYDYLFRENNAGSARLTQAMKKVLGASCECVSPVCADGNKAEGAREVRTEAERAFGKQEAPEDTPPSNSGITFVFQNN